jgi:hypothetical protein
VGVETLELWDRDGSEYSLKEYSYRAAERSQNDIAAWGGITAEIPIISQASYFGAYISERPFWFVSSRDRRVLAAKLK